MGLGLRAAGLGLGFRVLGFCVCVCVHVCVCEALVKVLQVLFYEGLCGVLSGAQVLRRDV